MRLRDFQYKVYLKKRSRSLRFPVMLKYHNIKIKEEIGKHNKKKKKENHRNSMIFQVHTARKWQSNLGNFTVRKLSSVMSYQVCITTISKGWKQPKCPSRDEE